MLKVLIEKELKGVMLSPKFPATFAVCSVLILLCVFIGIQEYRQSVKQFEAASQLSEQEMREASSWRSLSAHAYRIPDPMQIFSSGVNYDVGRFSYVSSFLPIKLIHSVYSDDPIFAVFRFVDLTFIVQIVLSMIAFLYTYDAVNGERERGTLKLVFANAVPRVKYILAKLLGAWLGLTLSLLIPTVLAFLLVILFKVPLQGWHWKALAMLVGVSLLYFTFFIALGLLVSTLTRRSSVSFLVCLVAWVVFVLILPRAGIMIAGQLLPAPTAAEIDARIDGFSKDRWDKHLDGLQERWKARNVEMQELTAEERETYQDEHMWKWMEEDDKERKSILIDVDEYTRKVNEGLRNRKAAQARLGFTLARLSPAAAYRLSAMSLAATDHRMKQRYEDAIQEYRTGFLKIIDKKEKESGGSKGVQISMSSDSGFSIKTSREDSALDVSDLPRFTPPRRSLGEIISAISVDAFLLVLYTLAATAGAFVAFLRYDVR